MRRFLRTLMVPAKNHLRRCALSRRARSYCPRLEALECRLQLSPMLVHQYPNNVQVTDDKGHPEADRSESFLAANPVNPSNMVGASKRFTDPSTYQFTVAAYATFDAGASWKEAAPLKLLSASDPGSGGETWTGITDPAIAWDNLGDTYLVTMAFHDDDFIGIAVYESSDGGNTWSPPNLIHQSAGNGYLGDDKPWVAEDHNPASPYYGNVYIAWDNDVDGGLDFARTTDHGKTWIGVKNFPAGSPLVLDASYAGMSVADDGTLYVVGRSGQITKGGTTYYGKIVFVKSTDGGTTFTGPVDVASGLSPLDDGALPTYGNPPFSFPALPGGQFRVDTFPTIATGTGGNVVVAWADYRDGVSRIYYRRSTNGGATWEGASSGQPLLTGSAASGKDQHDFHPQFARSPNGDIGVTFYEFGPKGGHGPTPLIDVVFAASVDDGTTFPSRLTVTSQPWDPTKDAPLSHGNASSTFIGDYFGLAASALGFFPFWTDTRTGIQEIFTDTVSVICHQKHSFYVEINSLTDHLTGKPDEVATVSTEARVQIGGRDGLPWGTDTYYQDLLVSPNKGYVPIHIDIVRHYHPKTEKGTLKLVDGEWYIYFPDGTVGDTGFDSSWDKSQIPVGFTVKFIGPPAGTKLGVVRTIDVIYDLASQKIKGVADGSTPLSGLPKVAITSAGNGSTPDITFTVSSDLPVFGGGMSWIIIASAVDRLHLFGIDGASQAAVDKWQVAPNGPFTNDWLSGLGGPVSSLAVGRNTDGRLELFAIDSRTHAVLHKRQTQPNGPFSSDWLNDLGGPVSAISVGSEADGRLELFAVDARTGTVEHKAQLQPNSSFSRDWINDLGGPVSAISVGRNTDGRLELFAIDIRTHAVLHKPELQPNSRFSTEWLNDLGGPVSAISVGSEADGRLELFAIDSRTSTVEHKAQLQPNSSFSRDWSDDLDGPVVKPVSAIAVGNEADGRLELLAVDAVTHLVVHQAEVRANGPFSQKWSNDLGDFSGPATHLEVATGSQSHVAGTPFAITVTARDAHNAIATGFRGTIHLSSTDPQATLPSDYTFTAEDNGVHTFTVTFRVAGTTALTIASAAATYQIGGGTTVEVIAGPAQHFVLSAPAATTAGQAFSIQVSALDAFNNFATNYTGRVHFSTTDQSAALPADYTFLPADQGVHNFLGSAILRRAGTQSITATDTANPNLQATQTGIVVSPAAASALILTGFPSPTTAGAAGNFTLTARDPYGNVATSYRGTVHFSSSDTQASLPGDYAFTAGANGVHAFTASLVTAGTQSLTAVDTALPGLGGTQAGIVVAPAVPDHFLFSTSVSTTVAGSPLDVTITVQDAYNNTVTGYTGTVSFSSSDPYGAILPGPYAFTTGPGQDNGVHVFAGGVTLFTAGNQSITATDLGSGMTSSVGIVVTPAAADHFSVSAPTSAVAGVPFDVTVTALDPFQNVDTNYVGMVIFTTSDTDPGVVLPAAYSFTAADQGMHTFTNTGLGETTLITPGDQTLTAADVSGGIVGSATITVLAGRPPSSPPAQMPVVVASPNTSAVSTQASTANGGLAVGLLFGSREFQHELERSFRTRFLGHALPQGIGDDYFFTNWNGTEVSLAGKE